MSHLLHHGHGASADVASAPSPSKSASAPVSPGSRQPLPSYLGGPHDTTWPPSGAVASRAPPDALRSSAPPLPPHGLLHSVPFGAMAPPPQHGQALGEPAAAASAGASAGGGPRTTCGADAPQGCADAGVDALLLLSACADMQRQGPVGTPSADSLPAPSGAPAPAQPRSVPSSSTAVSSGHAPHADVFAPNVEMSNSSSDSNMTDAPLHLPAMDTIATGQPQ